MVDPADYPEVAASVRDTGTLADELRRRLAVKAFACTSAYDAEVFRWFSSTDREPAKSARWLPDLLELRFEKIGDLRYGENPHQSAAFYREPGAAGPSVASARQIQGKELSFNNILT